MIFLKEPRREPHQFLETVRESEVLIPEDPHYLTEDDGLFYLTKPYPILAMFGQLPGGTRIQIQFHWHREPAPDRLDTLKEQLSVALEILKVHYRVEQLSRTLSTERLSRRNDVDEEQIEFPEIVGEEIEIYFGIKTRSAQLKRVFAEIEKVKNTELSIVLVGETGTGKELFARAIHQASPRAEAPFEVLNCGSVPSTLIESELFGHKRGAFSGAEKDYAGVFERAHTGTLVLDEVADMPLEMQQKILRVLQEHTVRPLGSVKQVSVDTRIVATTRHDLEAMVREDKFREDLYYRLNVCQIDIPPLRERAEDLPLLIEHFLAALAEEHGNSKRLAPGAISELLRYSWPGNVQELKNVLSRAFVTTSSRTIAKRAVVPLLRKEVALSDSSKFLQKDGELHIRVPSATGFNDIISEVEKLVITEALRRHRGNKLRVTQELGIPRQTLYNKLHKYKIKPEAYLEEE